MTACARTAAPATSAAGATRRRPVRRSKRSRNQGVGRQRERQHGRVASPTEVHLGVPGRHCDDDHRHGGRPHAGPRPGEHIDRKADQDEAETGREERSTVGGCAGKGGEHGPERGQPGCARAERVDRQQWAIARRDASGLDYESRGVGVHAHVGARRHRRDPYGTRRTTVISATTAIATRFSRPQSKPVTRRVTRRHEDQPSTRQAPATAPSEGGTRPAGARKNHGTTVASDTPNRHTAARKHTGSFSSPSTNTAIATREETGRPARARSLKRPVECHGWERV